MSVVYEYNRLFSNPLKFYAENLLSFEHTTKKECKTGSNELMLGLDFSGDPNPGLEEDKRGLNATFDCSTLTLSEFFANFLFRETQNLGAF